MAIFSRYVKEPLCRVRIKAVEAADVIRMKKLILIVGMICLMPKAKGQIVDSIFSLKSIDKTEIDALFSYYLQDGNHSAVTGGEGTEKLNVQAYCIKAKHQLNNKYSVNWKTGIDIITSASTDRIDYVLSSASSVDRRVFADVNLSVNTKSKNVFSIGTGVSAESDYLSIPIRASFQTKEKNNGSYWNFSADAAFDDLRWGRFNPDFYYPVRLVYPIELRGTDWSQEYKRQSYNFQSAYHFILNKKTKMSLMGGLSLQQGILSTPFHRIYLSNGNTVIEKLPHQRIKIPVGIQVNSFVSNQVILKQNLALYKDNFDISAIALEEEITWKKNPRLYLSFFARGYMQTKAKYYTEKGRANYLDNYYTSDFDLSAFTSINTGIEIFMHPLSTKKIKPFIKGAGCRVSYYKRSDGLWAVSSSLLLKM